VELTVVNASARYRCDTRGIYSCDGTSVDKSVSIGWSATTA
jgi:hypothetical protein